MLHKVIVGSAVVFLWTVSLHNHAIADATKHSPSIQDFDKDVREARIEMREHCSLTQALMKPHESDRMTKEKALQSLQNCRRKWAAVCLHYSADPPVGYSSDSRFGASLADIADAMEQMEYHLIHDRPDRSFQACSHACGLFVAMHEEHNLVYAIDRLFYLRKLTKTVVSVGTSVGPTAIGGLLPELMHLRDRVLEAPCPWPKDKDHCDRYRSSAKTLSGVIDDLAICMSSGDLERASEVLRGIFSAVNRAYGDAL